MVLNCVEALFIAQGYGGERTWNRIIGVGRGREITEE